mgnify:CR=1 FL=1
MIDRRVARTQQQLEQAFYQLLKSKQLSRITVTELAAKAGLNKGTFYLHYQDIYAFYDAELHKLSQAVTDGITDYALYFDDPAGFMVQYMASRHANRDLAHALLHAQEHRSYPSYTTAMMIDHIYACGRLARTRLNDILLESTLGGVNYILMKYRRSDEETAVKAATAMIANSLDSLRFKKKSRPAKAG